MTGTRKAPYYSGSCKKLQACLSFTYSTLATIYNSGGALRHFRVELSPVKLSRLPGLHIATQPCLRLVHLPIRCSPDSHNIADAHCNELTKKTAHKHKIHRYRTSWLLPMAPLCLDLGSAAVFAMPWCRELSATHEPRRPQGLLLLLQAGAQALGLTQSHSLLQHTSACWPVTGF